MIEIPPLRERGSEEILHLTRSFLNDIIERDGVSVVLGPDAIRVLGRHSRPGNVRELRGVIERAAAMCDGHVIHKSDLALNGYTPRITFVDELLRCGSLKETHREIDRILLSRVLDDAKGNVSAVARRLDVGRKALTNRLQELGLYTASSTEKS